MEFFFARRFNRFDAAVIVIVTELFARGGIGVLGLLGLTLIGFMASAAGEIALERTA